MAATLPADEAIETVAALADPVRRDLYRFVATQADGAGRDAAATTVGVSRALAAFHLDRLVDAGLLEVSFRRLGERRGPGAGRPAKIYRRADRNISINLPDRHYDVAGELLASAFEAAGATMLAAVPGAAPTAQSSIAQALGVAARDLGLSLGADARRRAGKRPSRARLRDAAIAVLGERGYEPAVTDDGSLILRNCPFEALASKHRALICGMNFSIMGGIVEGLRLRGIATELDPIPGRCCVVWGRSAS